MSAARTAEDYARIARTVAREASQLALAGFRKRPDIREKGPADLVTQYDLESERWIRKRLAELSPEAALLAEEEGGERHSTGLIWYCDPIDGTTNFAHGHPFWCVSIGLFNGLTPVAGAVVAPALLTEWFGGPGFGAFRNDEPCRVSQTNALRSALVGTGFPFDRSQAPANNFDSFLRVKPRAQAIRRCGSAALDLCLVADGTYDAYWERGLNPWDLGAGVAIASGAGATLSGLDGGPLDPLKGHVLVSNGHFHEELRALVLG